MTQPTDPQSLGAAIDRLAETVSRRAAATVEAPGASYTASLLAEGAPKCAQKLGEEGVELALAAVLGDKTEIRAEAADLLYHLIVLLRACDVEPGAVAAELLRREGVSGLTEKASRSAAP